MSAFQTIDLLSLEAVTGGADQGPTCAPNNSSIDVNGKIKVKTPVGVEVEGEGAYKSCTTNYASCLSTMAAAGRSPEQIKATCGLPPSNGSGT